MPTATTKVEALKEARKAALLARMRQGQALAAGTRSYFKSNLEGVSFWSPKEGDHILDVIPYTAGPDDPQVKAGEQTYVLEVYIHPEVGGIEDQTMICIEKTYKKPCPICEHRRVLQKEGADEDLVKSLQPKRYPRSIYNIVCYDSEKDESRGVQVFDASHFLFEMYLLKLAQGSGRGGQRPTGFIPFADPEEGKSIRFTRQGQRENTRYIAHAFEDRQYTIPKNILDSAHCLDQLIHIPTYEELYNAYWGDTPPEEAQPRSASDQRPKLASGTRGAAAKPETVAEEEGEPPPPEEEEEPPPPAQEEPELSAVLGMMSRSELKAFNTEQKLGIKIYKEQPDGTYSDEWIREQILMAIEASVKASDPERMEEEPPPTVAAGRSSAAAPAKPKPGECPGGGVFGKDLNDLPHCEVCKVWDNCMAENEKMLKQQQAAKDKSRVVKGPAPAAAAKGGRFVKK
jgi:hypothetical protein